MWIFVIAIIGVLVLCMGSAEYSKRKKKLSSMREKDRQMTNANLEQSLVDKYMKNGYLFDDAFDAAVQELVSLGFVPCIPRTAYRHEEPNYTIRTIGEGNRDVIIGKMYSSYIEGVGFDDLSKKYDSFEVQRRKELEKRLWLEKYGESISMDELDRMVYDNFPKTENEYVADLNRIANIQKALPAGTYIVYPKLGMCEILGHNHPESNLGTYKLKVLKTGEIINYVRIGDNSIQIQK